MNLPSLRFVEEVTLHKLSHFLPAQNPLKDFVHHNTLHAFQDKDFFTALQESSEIFGYKTFLPLSDFRKKLKSNKITNWEYLSRAEQIKVLNAFSAYYGLFSKFLKPE